MKRCPECRRDYYDETLIYCLEDGVPLVQGAVPAPDEPSTAILHSTDAPGEATTAQTAILPTGAEAKAQGSLGDATERQTISKHRAAKPLAVLVVAGLLFVGGFFGYKYFSTTKQIESIAVMPFVSESGNADLEYLSDGMTETLISSLSQLPNLNVKARSSVFRYKGKETSAQIIGKELNVQAILHGRVVQRGQDIVLYVELVDTGTENSLWKHTYSKTMTSLVALQNDVARDVADKLRVKLSATDRQKLAKNYTENTEAYQAYLRGRHFWNKGAVPGYEKSREFFQLAIEIDPTYALAYAGLADFYGFSAANGLSVPEESWPRCETAVNKALELDDSLSEAYNPLAAVKMYLHRDWPAAERAFRRGIELNPNFPEIRHHYGLRLVNSGRGEEGLAEIQRALDLDPLSVRFNLTRARLLFTLRDYDRAHDQMLKTLELDPNVPLAHEWLGNIYEQKKMHREAVAAWAKALTLRGETEKATALEQAFVSSGFEAAVRSLAKKEIERLDEKQKRGDYVAAGEYMTAYTRMGDKDQALAWFEKVLEDLTGFRFEVNINPIFDPLRGDPRFQELVKKVGNPN